MPCWGILYMWRGLGKLCRARACGRNLSVDGECGTYFWFFLSVCVEKASSQQACWVSPLNHAAELTWRMDYPSPSMYSGFSLCNKPCSFNINKYGLFYATLEKRDFERVAMRSSEHIRLRSLEFSPSIVQKTSSRDHSIKGSYVMSFPFARHNNIKHEFGIDE